MPPGSHQTIPGNILRMRSVNEISHADDGWSHVKPGIGRKQHYASAECCLAIAASNERMSCLESIEDKGSLGSAVGQAVECLELVY